MNILSIDTSTDQCCVMVDTDDKQISLIESQPKRHNEVLLDMINTSLTQANITNKDITHIAVGIGPGSFVGVRLGISAVKAYAAVLNPVIIPFSSLSAMSATAAVSTGKTHIQPIVNARMGDVYSASYHISESGMTEHTADMVCKVNELELLNDHLYIGDGTALYPDLATEYSKNLIDLKDIAPYIRQKIEKKHIINALDLEPVYLRGTQHWRKIKD